MKTPVTIEHKAVIDVPKRHWASLLRALSDHHHERHKSWAEMFFTNTTKCPLTDLAWKSPGLSRSAKLWLANIYQQYLSNFHGQLTFRRRSR